MDSPGELDFRPKMPERRDIPIGCIGAGFIMADCHLVAYRNAGLNPVAIASRNAEHAAAVADKHDLPAVHASYQELLSDENIEVVDIAVPPDCLVEIIEDVVKANQIRGILAQKPLGVCLADAERIVQLCESAGKTLCVNQNMRYDQSVRMAWQLIKHDLMGDPVLASIDMRAIPHWMPWQERQGWATCRIMSIHHLDTMRFWFGEPKRVYASFRPDPRTKFTHEDGIGLYILEYESGLRCQICDDVWTGPAREGAAADLGITYRIEGTRGLAKGTIGWPEYPRRVPSTLDYTLTDDDGSWHHPRWSEVWFPDAFLGPMAELLVALESGTQPMISGRDNLKTMALVDACYRSASEHQAVEL